MSLNKNHPLEKLSGFIDDLGLLLKKANTINLLTPTFQKYEKATSALLNYSKCFVLTTQMYKPSGPWSAMLKTNFRSDETTYLGVWISCKMESKKDWFKVCEKMWGVSKAIKNQGRPFAVRVRMINTYLILCMGYLACFKLILQSVSVIVWKLIQAALGAYANLKTTILTACHSLMGSKCQIHHFILFNWVLLISHKPLSCEYKNLLAIGAMRLDAYSAASKISNEVILGGSTKTNYSSLSCQVPIVLEDIYQEGGKIKCIIYNLAHTLKP